MSATIYLEGGAKGKNSKEVKIRCRDAFHSLLKKCGCSGRMPKLVACGSRNDTFDDFKTAFRRAKPGDYVGMWIDSEEPLETLDAPWEHLARHDGWSKPPNASPDQVLFMTTCMETMIVADLAALKNHYRGCLLVNALPPQVGLEQRRRQDIQEMLHDATRNCANRYAKGERSFEIMGRLAPAALEEHLQVSGEPNG